ncbi:MAG: amidohydrolase/deacetylase family metallohydrolase [Thermomicrobiales bacterium]|nr:amidohydrolase/deacetylase family metallohydrolase [Thermomicrobiales bacterium]
MALYDMVVRGGRVLDPAQDLDTVCDVAITGRRIVAIGQNLAAGGTRDGVIDATGLLVTPGMIDMHTHVFWGVPPLGIEPDPHCLARGVTTAVDAGSSGAATFPAFRRYVIDVSATRIVAMLHISSIGMARDDGDPDPVGELEDIRWARVDRAVAIAREHADIITGIKVRLEDKMVGKDPENCREALRRTQQAAEAIGKPAMVHVGGTTIPIDEILGAINTGDTVTHCFHGRSEGVLDERGKVRTSVRRAVERGVNFDVGHGQGSCNYGVARAALEQDLLPGTISSDIHAWNIAGPVYDLATTASKFLHLGLSLSDVIRRVTHNPARAIGMTERIGSLAPGSDADLSLLRLAEGEWPLEDSFGTVEIASQRLEPVSVIRAGRLYPCTPAVYKPHPQPHHHHHPHLHLHA